MAGVTAPEPAPRRSLAGALVPLLLLAVVAGAFGLRELQRPSHELPTGEALADGTRWLIDDPDAAYHLRRVELTLANGRVPGSDSFLNYPEGSPVPWPPLLDGALARLASLALKREGGDRELGGIDEPELEAWLAHAPPATGALATLVVFLATLALCRRGPARPWLALLAAALYAATPIAVWYGGVTRIDHHVFAALFLGLYLALLGWALRSEELTDATLGALLSGLVAGLALLTWLAFGAVIALGGVALAARALASDPARARDGIRAGILHFAVAGLVTLFPAESSPWNEVAPGSLVNLTNGVPSALFLAVLPFVVLGLPRIRELARPARAALALAAVAVGAVALPGFLAGVGEGLRWASRETLFMDLVDESRPLLGRGELDWLAPVRDLTAAVALLPVAWLLLLRRARRPEVLLLLLVSAALFALTLTQRRFGNALAVPLAIALAAGLGELLRPGRRALAGWIGALAVLGATALAALAPMGDSAAEQRALRNWRAEVVAGLRHLRDHSPSPGPWNAPELRPSYAVLSAWNLGHQIEYHARRPTLTTNFGSYVGAENFERAHRLLLEREPAEFVRCLRELGARYAVVTPRQAGDLKSFARIAGLQGQGWFLDGQRKARSTALWRLALTPPDTPPDHYPGLVRLWASDLRESISGAPPQPGELSGPVLSIYRLESPPRGEPRFEPR